MAKFDFIRYCFGVCLIPLFAYAADLSNAANFLAPSFDADMAADPMLMSPEGIFKDSALRDVEHLQHSSLWGHQYIGGGAGEGKQFLSPSGLFPNKQQVKSDELLPAYCDPPNPCPPGFSGDDGCLEEFENSAEFSRNYQSSQKCLCDEDHMFSCPPNHRKVGDGLPNDDDEDLFSAGLDALLEKAAIKGQHKLVVAKKFHEKKRRVKRNAENKRVLHRPRLNPYLKGERLHVVAKKG